jgi:hypothetical protein
MFLSYTRIFHDDQQKVNLFSMLKNGNILHRASHISAKCLTGCFQQVQTRLLPSTVPSRLHHASVWQESSDNRAVINDTVWCERHIASPFSELHRKDARENLHMATQGFGEGGVVLPFNQ